MNAGDLDRRVTLERATVTLDAFGGETQTWATLAEVWAQAMPVSDGEKWRAAEVAATISTRFRIRWRADLRVGDRLIYDGRVFDIIGVKEIGRREGLEITASARAE
jgi:SPP1 family predicted phage head-tail adaptor